ncbi:hypothetical protein NXG27_04190 [Megasphaera paucivorans]|uniref:Uncharacterized protein n=1 Tax=Megasphaera paucivorans TaxID=349095 RepID=A0A1G9QTP2_9FIRM|nr:hypothetical protein [Megasphaera paucivorans]SDM14241.1 hypothetical protein SAMN05660299_00274 [Megasphaera paucivorans]
MDIILIAREVLERYKKIEGEKYDPSEGELVAILKDGVMQIGLDDTNQLKINVVLGRPLNCKDLKILDNGKAVDTAMSTALQKKLLVQGNYSTKGSNL